MDDGVVPGGGFGSGPVESTVEPPAGGQPPPATLSATLQPSVNAALWQNHVPVVPELALTAGAPKGCAPPLDQAGTFIRPPRG